MLAIPSPRSAAHIALVKMAVASSWFNVEWTTVLNVPAAEFCDPPCWRHAYTLACCNPPHRGLVPGHDQAYLSSPSGESCGPSLRLFFDSLRKIAFDERIKIHDLVLEGIDAALRRRGYPSVENLKAGKRR
jgi:hypothetical protein